MTSTSRAGAHARRAQRLGVGCAQRQGLRRGGEQRTSDFQRTFRAVQADDPKANRWTALPPMEFPRHGLAADIIDGRFHLVSEDAASGGAPGAHIDNGVREVLAIDAK